MGESTRTVALLVVKQNADRAAWVSLWAEHVRRAGWIPTIWQTGASDNSVERPSRDGVVYCPELATRFRRYRALRRLAGWDRPDLLHVLDFELADAGLDLAFNWRLPYLISLDEFPPRDTRLRVARKWCRGLLVCSDELATDLTAGFGIPPEMVHVVAPPWFATLLSARIWTAGEGIPVVGVHNLGESPRQIESFLVATSDLREMGHDVEFLIGDTEASEVRLPGHADIQKIDNRITFAAGTDGVAGFWNVVDVFCWLGDRPTSCRSIATALAHGIPTVANTVMGVDRWIEDRVSGRLIAVGDGRQLASALTEVLSNPDASRAMARNGRDRVLRICDAARGLSDLMAHYQRLIGAQSRERQTRGDSGRAASA